LAPLDCKVIGIDEQMALRNHLRMTKLLVIWISLFSLQTFALDSRHLDLREELHRAVANHTSYSYDNARKQLFNVIYLQKDTKGYYIQDVYCEDKYYPFDGASPGNRLPNPNDFNTEHTWPQSKFSKLFAASIQKSDLHHLYPTFSKINGQRGNLPFAEVLKNAPLFCDASQLGKAELTNSGTYFEPPASHKGNVARSMFYFSIRYKIEIDATQEYYLRLWNKEDPVDEFEKSRHEKVAALQLNRNPFIDKPELVDSISDF
jgi:deoxyribonuclease-1